MRASKTPILLTLAAGIFVALAVVPAARAHNVKQPNIVMIMGDDIGIWSIGAYHRGMMAGRTPNIDQLAREGAIFTDYYAEASCTAGRANFITGQLPIRTGLTKVLTTGGHTSSGDSCSCKSRWLNWHRLRSTFHRCSQAPVSTSKQSKNGSPNRRQRTPSDQREWLDVPATSIS